MAALEWLKRRMAGSEPRVFAQGDVVLLGVADAAGEHTGHRHAFYRGASLYHDVARAGDVPPALYIGHVESWRAAPSSSTAPGPAGAATTIR